MVPMMHLKLRNVVVAVAAIAFSLLPLMAGAASSKVTAVLKKPSKRSTSQPATYNCELSNLWTRSRHPNGFPGGAHWSPPVFVSHNDGYRMFRPATRASNGVEVVAEVRFPEFFRPAYHTTDTLVSCLTRIFSPCRLVQQGLSLMRSITLVERTIRRWVMGSVQRLNPNQVFEV